VVRFEGGLGGKASSTERIGFGHKSLKKRINHINKRWASAPADSSITTMYGWMNGRMDAEMELGQMLCWGGRDEGRLSNALSSDERSHVSR